jgi:hypothetical protein
MRAIRKEPEMERQSVASSLIRSVGYDPAGSIMEVEFIEPGRIYTFYDVPYSVYDELMEAPSKGRYFNEFIRDDYPYEVTYEEPLPSEAPDESDEADKSE